MPLSIPEFVRRWKLYTGSEHRRAISIPPTTARPSSFFAAYGLAFVGNQEILARLLALNHERSAAQ